MTNRVQTMLAFYRTRNYRKNRNQEIWDLATDIRDVDDFALSTIYMKESLGKEKPVLFEDDIFGFNRHMKNRPGVAKGPSVLVQGRMYHERISNVVPEYHRLISSGFDAILEQIDAAAEKAEDTRIYQNASAQLLAILELCDRYRDAAKATGHTQLAAALDNIPRKAANSFYEACLFQKILIFAMRCGGYKHLAMGRFDQYMYPYFLADLQKGISEEALLETLELYFISLNFDTDLYDGIQQGDNGQSIVLGGFDMDGTDRYNRLSDLCLQASADLCLIDPKINIRVSKATPDELYEKGTKLTKCGLGFPQYCNDDVIIPGLIRLGYAPEDAYNYAVAACWEPIIPGRGADIPNRKGTPLPTLVAEAILEKLPTCADWDALLEEVSRRIHENAEKTIAFVAQPDKYYFSCGFNPSPLLSLMMDGCLESGRDVSDHCLPYHNTGIFSVGIATAADALYSVKKAVFEEKFVRAEELVLALQADYLGYEGLHNHLLSYPKMGDDNDDVDAIAARLMDMMVDAYDRKPNGHGGIWRVGTGSAQLYSTEGKLCPATPDGRKAGQPFGCSFSPAPGTRIKGPLSVIRSFTKRDLTDMISGGPITMELHDNVFRNTMGEQKVAQLVKLFVLSGGHQLQLNAINRDLLLEAQAHPENYPNLIVRVWGWSGYFTELDPQYQNHIIRRTEHTF